MAKAIPATMAKAMLDDGYVRAALASEEMDKSWNETFLFNLGATNKSGKLPVTSRRAAAALQSQESCRPPFLQASYMNLTQALSRAQVAAFPQFADRWLELQRVDDLTRFLSRSDVSVLSKREVSRLGNALAAAQVAGHNARMDFVAALKKSEEGVPDRLADAIRAVQVQARSVAGNGFRCRATAFF